MWFIVENAALLADVPTKGGGVRRERREQPDVQSQARQDGRNNNDDDCKDKTTAIDKHSINRLFTPYVDHWFSRF